MNSKAMELNPANQAEIIAFLRKSFSDYFEFDDIMIPLLRKILDTLPITDITMESTRTLMERVGINVDSAITMDQKKQNERIKIVLTTCYVLLLSLKPESQAMFYGDISELLRDFESFSTVDDKKELQFLLAFRNYLVVALRIVPAKGNKIFLLKVVERLEGSEEEYITGTGQKPAVSRRIAIYEKEGNIRAKTYKTGSSSNSNSSNNLVDLTVFDNSEKKQPQKRKREINHSLQVSDDRLEGAIDELFSAPASVSTYLPTGIFSHEAANALLSLSGQQHQNATLVNHQLSEVAAGIAQLDSTSHNKLLHEPYKGSFTEFIEQSKITM